MGRVVVIGSVNGDSMIVLRERLERGGTGFVDYVASTNGGKGLNQVLAAAANGAACALVACIGSDSTGRRIVGAARDAGVDTTHVCITDKVETGHAFIFVEPDGSSTIAVDPGANSWLQPDDLPEIREDDVVLVQFEIPFNTVAAALSLSRSVGARVLLSLSPLVPGAIKLACLSDFLVCNRGEAVAVTGLPANSRPEALATELLALGASAVIITLGADGIVVAEAEALTFHPASTAVSVRDTTGAGDAFLGALAAALARGESFGTAITIGQQASALAIEHVGA